MQRRAVGPPAIADTTSANDDRALHAGLVVARDEASELVRALLLWDDERDSVAPVGRYAYAFTEVLFTGVSVVGERRRCALEPILGVAAARYWRAAGHEFVLQSADVREL